MENNDVNIPLPKSLYDLVAEHIKGTEFRSVAEYVAFVVKEVLTDEEPKKDKLSQEEEAQVKETLKKLGYIKDEQT